jgi:hypothetical protein
MASANTTSQQIYDLLVSRNFDPSALDLMGKSTDPAEADLFSFEYKTPNKNYGTVVILVDSEKNLEFYFGDNLGKTIDAEDKQDWYDFLYTVRMLAKRNLLTFSLNNMNKLKYNMKTMAAVTEGKLLEGYYGTSKTSYSDQPKKTKLVIKHSRPLGDGEQRFRNIQSLFVETDEGERFKLPFINITGGKAMARHVAEGGNPYDAFGQYIAEMMTELATLGRFSRATRNSNYGDDAQALVEQAVAHYNDLKRKAKRMISKRGYREEFDNFNPMAVTEVEETVNAVREIFVQQTLDSRVEEALPILARIQDTNMKEINEFEDWANNVIEGTGPYAHTPEQIDKLKSIMAEPLPVGADALNASETIGDLLGGDDQLQDDLEELAAQDPNADARPLIQATIDRLGIELDEARNPYAIGMAQAMRSTGDKPPLSKSTITKAHKIAKAIEKDEVKDDVNEAKEGYCSDKCCGSEVKAEDCTCPPDCPHCDCNAVDETVDIDTGKQALKAERDPMLEDELESLLRLIK